MSTEKPSLDEVCANLKSILEKMIAESDDMAVPYAWLCEECSSFALPTSIYLEFLSNEGFLILQEDADIVTLTEQGLGVLDENFDLSSRAYRGFQEHILSNSGLENESVAVEDTHTMEIETFNNAQNYERLEEIGTGGFGTVYLANQRPLNRKVALKEISEIFNVFAGVQKDDIITRFSKIVHQQASLNHPNIIHLIDLVIDQEYPYVVMSYAENGNLRRLINAEGRPPLEIALKYFLQILHAFNTAHQKGIFHGGVKPENIVLDSAGNALVTDFGISMVADLDFNKGNQVFIGVGTVAYMSPEQFANPNTATACSDIYSLGILLYEMLTGKMPGRRSPMPSTFFQDIPTKLDDIFDKMSMDNPSDRYQSIDEILIDIYSCASIMSVLDKRSGFQFLRDPLTYGSIGMEGLEGIEPFEAATVFHSSPLNEGEPSEETPPPEPPKEEQESEESQEILGKLDRYSGVFEGGEEGEHHDENHEHHD